MKVCVINHWAKKNKDNCFVDYNNIFPDPYRDKNYGTTGICRNVSKKSPQSVAYEYFQENKEEDIYFLYCSNYYGYKYFTGLLKINNIFENHYEFNKISTRKNPNNLVFQEKFYKNTKEFKHYKKRQNYPYVEGQWDERIINGGLKSFKYNTFIRKFKKEFNIDDLRHGTWAGFWVDINSEEELTNFINKFTEGQN